jgi:hypothetical protein
MRAGNISKCLHFPASHSYDAHYIIGDSLPGSLATELYTSASVHIDNGDISAAHGGGWLKLSKSRQWTGLVADTFCIYPNSSSGSAATNLYLHMDENLQGFTRTGTVTVKTTNNTEKTIVITQLSAIPIGMYDYTPTTTNVEGNYDRLLYTEQLYEYPSTDVILPTMPIFSPLNAGPLSKNNIYNGWNNAYSNGLTPPNPTNQYSNYTYQAINYCANKNRGATLGGAYPSSGGSLLWYLPSQAQLMAMYVFYEAYKAHPTSNFLYKPDGSTVVDPFYWSSTANESFLSPNKEAQYIDFRYGNTGHKRSNQQMIARCVRSSGASDFHKGRIPPSSIVITTYPTIDFSAPYPLQDSMVTTRAAYYTTLPKIAVDGVFGAGTEIAENNEKVYQKLRVAVRDTSVTNVTWATATAQCASYTENGDISGWRLPTQRELLAIWIVQDGIKAKCTALSISFDYLNAEYYWSATESSEASGNAWMVFGGRTGAGDAGNTPHYLKTEAAARVRCVREQ